MRFLSSFMYKTVDLSVGVLVELRPPHCLCRAVADSWCSREWVAEGSRGLSELWGELFRGRGRERVEDVLHSQTNTRHFVLPGSVSLPAAGGGLPQLLQGYSAMLAGYTQLQRVCAAPHGSLHILIAAFCKLPAWLHILAAAVARLP